MVHPMKCVRALASDMRCAQLAFPFIMSLACHAQAFEWTRLEPFPGSARDDAASFTIGNTVFVGTGRAVDFSLTNDWYAFDMVEGNWTAIAALPASGRQYCTAFTDGTHGYLFGGVDDSGPLNQLWRYAPLLDQWQTMAPLPSAGRYASVAFDNGMVCTGLLDGGVATDGSWQYDPSADSWAARAAVPGPARHRAAGSGTMVYVVGGSDEEGNALSDVHVYNEGSDTWTAIDDLPEPRYGADAVYNPLVDQFHLVAGASSASAFQAEAWTFNATTWESISPFAGGPRRGGVIAIGTPNGPSLQQVYYGTGTDGTQRYNDWWMYLTISEGIEERPIHRSLAYPDPSTGLVRFDLGEEQGTLRYTITDMAGRSVAEGSHSSTATMDLTFLPAGRYTIVFLGGRTFTHSSLSIVH